MIPVAVRDIPQASQALLTCAEGPIFLHANLLRHGIGCDHPHSLSLWRNDDWTAFIGLSNAGVCFPQMAAASEQDFTALPVILKNHSIVGMNGEARQVGRTLAALNLEARAAQLDRIEPCYALQLDALRSPDTNGLSLRAPQQSDMPLLTDWRAAYRAEVMGDDPSSARTKAAAELPLWLANDALRLAIRDGEPAALTGFNARLPHLVQIGGVYTPPALRGQGLARRALALHLAEARNDGAERAFLFAASDHAARAYTAIGFTPAGQMRIVIFKP